MTPITITILKPGRCDDYGLPYEVGNTYSVEPYLAKSLWQAGFASVNDVTVFKNLELS